MKIWIIVFFSCFLLGAKTESYQPCYKADLLFVVDYSSSVSDHVSIYEPWLRGLINDLPISESLRAGFLFFSSDVCPIFCPLTENKLTIDEKVLLAQKCPSSTTYIEPAFRKANELFHQSEVERGEKVPKIIIVVTDSDVSDEVEACEFIHSEMSDISFILVDLNKTECVRRIDTLIGCMLYNDGVCLNSFAGVYKVLFEKFKPCM